ncbi:DEKNAAC103092 [Brettanomyces naardenensis]|uniref:Stress-associated endoplasmic reticulum protein n=1 Tax=Brettanomyces naardenensis TaxID=13370 RepID=A0A448YMJ5_BRENA|nr:DEKNAAC103092 [Brettanomyces naardenensis]
MYRCSQSFNPILTYLQAVQTPRQRLANQKFAKKLEKQMGKPKPKKVGEGPEIPKWLIFLLCFLIMGGGLLELTRLFF